MKQIIKLFLSFMLVVFAISNLAASNLPESELAWKNIMIEGKKTAVYCIYQDLRGIIWIGTNNGLHFFDGITTHPVETDELDNIHIRSIVNGPNKLYLGASNGLKEYDYTSGTITTISTLPKEIMGMTMADNTLWIGALNGIFRLNTKNGSLEDQSSTLPHKSVYSIIRDSRGIIYVGTYDGLARWESGSNKFIPVSSETNLIRKISFVNCLMEASDFKSIFVGGKGALYQYFPFNNAWKKIEATGNNNIKCITYGPNNHLLVGTDNGFFEIFGNDFKYYKHDSRHDLTIADNEIWSVFSDKDNNIWAGHERGFSIASGCNPIRTVKLASIIKSGEGNEIYSMLRDKSGILWLGGTNGLISLSDYGDYKWFRHDTSKNSLSHNRIRDIIEDSDKNIWICTDGGINRFNPQSGHFDVFNVVDKSGKHNSNWVYSLVEDGSNFWIGSYLGGIHCVDKRKIGQAERTVVSSFSLNSDKRIFPTDFFNKIVKDADGYLWILLFRDKMLYRYSINDHKIKKYDIFKATGEYPTHVSSDSKGRFWCAFKGGVVFFDEKYKSHIIKFPYTGGDETVLAIAKVGNNMWISTSSNVWEINGNNHACKLLPIPQKSYTSIYDDKLTGKVLLGGMDEIVEIDRNELDSMSKIDSIRLILRDKGNGNYNLSDIINISDGFETSSDGNVSFIISTLDYSPESIQRYMYKLAKSETDMIGEWIVMPEGVNTISFSNLKSGEYKILIKKVSSTSTPLAIPLSVAKHWSLSWWAICIYIIIFAGIVVQVVWLIRKRNNRRNIETERKKVLEEVDKKITFLSNISHDLKTPLSMILGPVSLMKEKIKDPENRKTLQVVYNNAVKLNNMIHKTIELKHIDDNDESFFILSTFDIVEFYKNIFDSFKENNPDKKFIFLSSCNQLLIEADAVKFESILTNLLSNACKYSEENATITCGISQNDNKVEIIISDDGMGIAEIDQPLVFQRMFRAPATAKLREGTGLGLYLIKKYLDFMGGSINLYSKEGQGTSFIVTLPLSEKEISTTSREEKVNPDNPKILIVEDNLQISSFIAELLKDDYSVLTAENGRTGLSIAASFVPDLFIVDEMMPIMTGLEMCKRIKQNPRLSNVPIIVLTAKDDNATETESIRSGVDAFMSKPFEPSSLLARISQLLRQRIKLQQDARIQHIMQPQPIEAESAPEKLLAKIAQVLEENISDPDLNVTFLCEKCGLQSKQLYRIIKRFMGVGALDYIKRIRLQKAAMLLSQHRFTVAEVSYMVGFKTPSYFAKCFQEQYGVKPSQYQSDDETIASQPKE